MRWSPPKSSTISTSWASPRTPREEKKRARDANAKARGAQKNDAAYDARMAALYREVVLKEKPVVSEGGFIPLDSLSKPNGNGNGLHGIAPAPAPAAKPEVGEPVAGD